MYMAWTIPNKEFNSERIENPSAEHIREWMGKLDDGWWSSFYIIDQKKNTLTVINASEDRVMVNFWGYGSKPGGLMDPAYLESDERIEVIGEPDGSPYMFYETVQNDVAINVLAYFAKNGKLPGDYSWGGYGKSLDEFIG